MRDIVSAIDVRRVIEYGAYGNGDGGPQGVIGSTIDILGFDSLAFIFDFGTYGGANWEFVIEGSDDESEWTELDTGGTTEGFPNSSWAAEITVAPPLLEGDGGSPTFAELADSIVKVGVTSWHRYYRVRAEYASGTPDSYFGVSAVLSHASQQPVP